MRQLQAWVTASKRSYQSNIFTRTWWNIVVFHTFFVIVMVIVFGYILYYTKLNIFATLASMLTTIASGGIVDSSLITQTSRELDLINIIILCGMVVFAVVTGIIAARITLIPTRYEFAQRKKFITAVAHELRTPLAVLRTSNEVALYDISDTSPVKNVIRENIEETKNIANILNNLVVFSRVETVESLAFEPTDLQKILEDVVAKLAPFASKNKVSIHYTPSVLPQINGNRTALEQAFYNILKNAVIYSNDDGGKIQITTLSDDEHVSISCADTGIGISDNALKHIFEPFYRIDPDDSPSSSGSGLGLALVLEIIKLHQGSITVHSILNKGTTFTLRFPVQTSLSIPTQERTSNSVTHSFSA